MRLLRVLAAVLLLASMPVATTSRADGPYLELVGALHEHSGYSDGWPGTTPKTYFDRARDEGLDFLASGEHSDNADIPVTFSDGCTTGEAPACVDTDIPDSLRKWEATLEQARAASTSSFTGIRGFEWTSDRYGHINVYYSHNDVNAKIDGGYMTMATFWNWFNTPANLGGGADGIATFNHPGSKKLPAPPVGGPVDEPANDWNDFEYVPAADARMVGIEVYNDEKDYGSRGPSEGYYVHALDKGWHVGAVGAEDLHGIPDHRDDYGSERWAKTIVLATENNPAAIRSALMARRFYATRYDRGLRLDFSVDGSPMGSRLVRRPGMPVHVVASATDPGSAIEIVTSGGRIVATATGSIDTTIPWTSGDRYYFMRVRDATGVIGYGSPVWLSATRPMPVGQWLAGDLHVHTCFSHDAYCGPNDDNTPANEGYTLSGNVNERFTEASLRGLDFLAITDHNDVRSVSDPASGSHNVMAIPAYEASLRGHAQILGTTKVLDHGDQSPATINALADELRSTGGVFQANHPAKEQLATMDATCSDMSAMDWKYGFDVRIDSLEVWSISPLYQPPLPSSSSNDDALIYWDCWLNRGARVAATGGSDSHWLALSLAQGPGNPTTWVFASDRSPEGVLDAIRRGRTSVSLVPPLLTGLKLILEADADRNGVYESMVGDDVPPGTPMRVRADGLSQRAYVDVRANGKTIVSLRVLEPNGVLTFTSPSGRGWVRATMRGWDARDQRTALCDPLLGVQTTYCRNHIVQLALTSPIYLR